MCLCDFTCVYVNVDLIYGILTELFSSTFPVSSERYVQSTLGCDYRLWSGLRIWSRSGSS